MKINKYENYFHFNNSYKINCLADDTKRQMKFLYNQLMLVDNKIGLKNYQDCSILEIGSGLGSLAKLLLNRGFKNYHGIDMDKNVVEFTVKTIGNYFENNSIENFKYNEKKYALIFAFEVLEHLDCPEKRIKIINNILDKEGIFIGTTPFPYKKNILADKTHLYCLHPSNWKKLFLENGFKRVETYPLSYFPFLWRINKYLNFRIPFYVPFKYFISTALIISYKK